MGSRTELVGRLVLPDAIVTGRLVVEGDRIAAVELDGSSLPASAAPVRSPGSVGSVIVPGFIDIHVHGWSGHDAMDGPAALSGMARALVSELRRLLDENRVFHDGTGPLDDQVRPLMVTESTDGPRLKYGSRTDAIKATVWAVQLAGQPLETPRIW